MEWVLLVKVEGKKVIAMMDSSSLYRFFLFLKRDNTGDFFWWFAGRCRRLPLWHHMTTWRRLNKNAGARCIRYAYRPPYASWGTIH